LVEDPLCVGLIAIEVHAHLVEDGLEVFNDLRGGLQTSDEFLHQIRSALIDIRLLYVLELAALLLLLPAD
jgi:hypothetical protein